MELATDIMAILGWAYLGCNLPFFFGLFSSRDITSRFERSMFIAFGLIAASIVLG